MLNESQRAMLGSHGILVGRTLLGLLFVFTGYGMFTAGSEAIGGYFASVGVPMATLMFWPVVLVKIGAGLALILGYRVGCAATALILFTLGATYFGHSNLSDMNNVTQIFKNLAIVGGLLYVAAFGAGTGWRLKK
jgi:putative oxidoreductase